MSAYRVLVVDDNHDVRRMVIASLKTLGPEIDVLDVPSAEEALFISASLPLDLVVLDFRLPGMTGMDMLSRLRKRRPETRIILVTGVEDTTIRQQVASSGVDAYFFKPLEIDAFLEAVKHCLWPSQAEPLPPSGTPNTALSLEGPQSGETSGNLVAMVEKSISHGLLPTLDERLTSLRQQLHAASVILVNNAGQILEVVGNPMEFTSGSTILSTLMDAYRANLQVSRVLGRATGPSLQYFASQRQCLYMAPVGENHALFITISGYIDPDKLGTIDRLIQTSARDLQDILSGIAAREQSPQASLEKMQAELASKVTIDHETLDRVERMFATAASSGAPQGADSFWDEVENKDASAEVSGKDVLTYDQARDLGLNPGDAKPA